MFPIRWNRVILGGLAAGLVINVVEFLFNGVVLADAWSDALRALDRPTSFSKGRVASFFVWGFLIGIAAVALYATIRDRFGPGLRTAIYAGLSIWAVAYLFAAIPSAAMHLFPRALLFCGVGIGLVEAVAATIAGAWLYRPAELGSSAVAG